ncbi:hypothetical protein BKI52_02155 [marine bacterium AO1-C]|nr:hypothetical protein BKI52_02155 [marine bacterium AO1-C]
MKTPLHCFIYLIFIFSSFTVFAQKITVTGKVVDEQGDPLIVYIHIFEKGTARETVTDVKGAFSLQVSKGSTLTFSFISFKTKEIKVEDSGSYLNLGTIKLHKNDTPYEIVILCKCFSKEGLEQELKNIQKAKENKTDKNKLKKVKHKTQKAPKKPKDSKKE